MNKTAKLKSSQNPSSSPPSSSSSMAAKKKKQQQQSPGRKPLNDLNSISAEAGRRGCFGFLKDPKPRTPKSAPPSKNPTNPSNSRKKPSKTVSENPKLPVTTNPPLNRRKPSSKDPILEPGHSSKCQKPYPNPNPVKNGGLSSETASSPEKTLSGSSPRMGLEASNTPNSNSTPPVQASISPEIACGSNVEPTPVCFAAGYVVAGVHDRRKCRPRGILTVGGDGGDIFTSRSRTASPPPIAGASIQWVSSPSGNFNGCREEASVNWLLSPRHDADGDHSFWRLSLTNSDTSGSPVLKGFLGAKSPDLETTPSSGNAVRTTPTSSSSISPFSAIVRRANAASSGFRIISPCPDTFSISTPSSNSKSRRISGSDSASDLPLPLPALSFQFSCPSTPSSSIDLTGFKKQAKVSPLKSEFNVSWREGLVSRIYEMGDFDCCKWHSDDEDNINCHGDDEREYVFGCSLANGSASFEFPRGGKGCAESMNLENAGLVSSGDSDWTFSYNNGLFDSKR